MLWLGLQLSRVNGAKSIDVIRETDRVLGEHIRMSGKGSSHLVLGVAERRSESWAKGRSGSETPGHRGDATSDGRCRLDGLHRTRRTAVRAIGAPHSTPHGRQRQGPRAPASAPTGPLGASPRIRADGSVMATKSTGHFA